MPKGVLIGGPHHGKVMGGRGRTLDIPEWEDVEEGPNGAEFRIRRPACTYRWTKLGEGLNTVHVWLADGTSKAWALNELMLE